MGIIKEPKNIDFSFQSKPWTEKELIEFRKLMHKLKSKNAIQKKTKRSKAFPNP